MISVPKIGILGGRDGADFLPTVLQGAEVVVGLLQRLIGSNDSFEFFEDSLLLGEVLLFLLLKVFVLLGAVGLEDAKSRTEALLQWVFFMLVSLGSATTLQELLQLVIHVFLVQLIEMESDGGNFVLNGLDIRFLDDFFEQFDKLQLAQCVKLGNIFHQIIFVFFHIDVGDGFHFGQRFVLRHGLSFRGWCIYEGLHLDADLAR